MKAEFENRVEAGRLLAEKLQHYAGRKDVLVLALPRGGVPVACEVARSLRAPFDVFTVRKLGVPGHEELAMGAIATGGVRVVNARVVHDLKIPAATIQKAAQHEQLELERREAAYRGARLPPVIADRIVILIDDGIATGSTMRAAISAVRQQRPSRIVVAVPTAAPSTCEELRHEADEVIAVMTPEPFYGVGQWYQDFAQTTDEEVRAMLAWTTPKPAIAAS